MNELINHNLVEQIKTLLEASRQKIAATVNTTLLHTYWQIGKIIVEDEALHIGDSEYEKQSLRQLSKVLTTEFGKGFSRSNLSNMRQFYLTHKDVQTASGQLSWSHCGAICLACAKRDIRTCGASDIPLTRSDMFGLRQT